MSAKSQMVNFDEMLAEIESIEITDVSESMLLAETAATSGSSSSGSTSCCGSCSCVSCGGGA